MKRGLVLPPAADHGARVAALRARMAEADVQAALIYGDVARSDDIAHLTNLCIYWNEGVLGVPADGEPALLSKLSKRVHPWMRRTSTLTDLRSGRDLAKLIGEWAGGAGRLGLVDRDLWPAALVAELGEASAADLIDMPDAVRAERLVPDAGTARELGERLAAAMAKGDLAEAERRLRAAGALDVLATRRGGVFDVRVQQHGIWLRAARGGGGDVVRIGHHADLAPGAPWRDAAGAGLGEVVVRETAGGSADSVLITADGEEVLTRARVG